MMFTKVITYVFLKSNLKKYIIKIIMFNAFEFIAAIIISYYKPVIFKHNATITIQIFTIN